MKMIKLLVLRNGKMVKLPPYANVGKIYDEKTNVIGAVYNVSEHVYSKRKTKIIKKLLVESIDTCSFFTMPS